MLESHVLENSSAPERKRRLPPRERAFGALLDGKSPRFLPTPDRFKVKEIVLALAAEYRCHVNDILDLYKINRITYYYFVDPLKSGDAPTTAKPEEARETHRIFDLPPADQLRLLIRVESLQAESMNLFDACEHCGITTHQYYRLAERRKELEGRAKGQQEQPKNLRRFFHELREIPDKETQALIADAAMVLALATGQRLAETARLLGTTYENVLRWRTEQNLEPIFQTRAGRKLPLRASERQLGTGQKIRFIRAVRCLQQDLHMSGAEITTALGFKQKDIDEWTRTMRAMEKIGRDGGQDVAAPLDAAGLEQLAGEAGQTIDDLQPWLHAFDIDTLSGKVSMAHALQPPFELGARELLEHWEEVWRGRAGPKTFDTLVRYYRPIAGLVARQMKTHFPPWVMHDTLEGYALLGVLEAIKRFGRDGGKFFAYACKCAEGAIHQGIAEDSWMPARVQEFRRSLQGVLDKWRKTHEKDPDAGELAGLLAMPRDEVQELLPMLGLSSMRSLDTPATEGKKPLGEFLEDKEASNGTHDAESPDLETLFVQLPDEQRTLMQLHYVENYPMHAIAAEMRIPEVDAWTLHRRALMQLRQYLLSQKNGSSQLHRSAAWLQANTHEQTNGAKAGNGTAVTKPRFDNLETLAATAPNLLDRATRWVSYALANAPLDHLINTMKSRSYTDGMLGNNIRMPENVNRREFRKAALLVLQSKNEG